MQLPLTSANAKCRHGHPVVLTAEAELELPELHAEFRVPVQKFFG